MRIALFSDHFYPELGGIQDSILASATELGARGHAVAIVAPAASPRDYARAGLAVAEPDLGPTVTVHRQFALPAPGSTGQSRLALPTGRRWRQLAAFRPDVIHSHSFLGLGLEAMVAARRLGVPLVGTNHWAAGAISHYAPFARDAVAGACWRALAGYYNRCTWVSAPSRATLRDMRAHGLRRPGAVVSNPIDTARFRPPVPGERAAAKARLGLGNATVLFAGRLGPEKRIDVLLRALPALRRRVPGAELVLAGHGTARPALAALAGELGIATAVRFVGTLSHDALAEMCRAADVFAIASTSESQSMVLLQAMSAGLPLVGARDGPLAERITPETGVLAEPGDAEAFADALATLLQRPDLRARMGEQATRAVAGLGVPAVTDVWQDVYDRARRGDALSLPSNWSPSCA
jgi:glycosyltransferase involved in cell wall biosynthesis